MGEDDRVISISDEDIAAEICGVTLEGVAERPGRLNRWGGAGTM